MHKKIFAGRIILTISACFLALGSLAGCATSYGRQNDSVQVYFKSNAEKFTISCSGESVDMPGSMQLKRLRNHDCVAKANGFEDLNFRIWSRLSSQGFRYSTQMNYQKWSKWTFGIGNIFAWPVDFFSGAMKTFDNDHYDLRLRTEGTTSSAIKILNQTGNIIQKVASVPADVVEKTTSAVMTAAVQKPAEALGVASEEQRKEIEKLLEDETLVK